MVKPATTLPKAAATADTTDTAAALAAVQVTDDVIEYTIACALALSPPELRAELRQHIAQHTSKQVRRVFGGKSQTVVDASDVQYEKAMDTVPIKGNVFEYMLECVFACTPSAPKRIKNLVLKRTSTHFGQENHYLKNYVRDLESRNAKIRSQHQAGAQVNYLARHHGLSRSYVSSLVNAKKG